MDDGIKNIPKLLSRDSTFLNSKISLSLSKSFTKKKVRKLRKSTIEKPREITIDQILHILIKPRSSRNIVENKLLSEYLSSKYEYFKKIKETEPNKLDKLCKVLNYETFSPKETIINFGEPGEKFYIVFNGKVGVYKPIYKEKEMSLNEYYTYMMLLKKNQKIYKMKRIIEKNQHLNIDLNILSNTPENSYYMRRTLTFIMEENEKLGEFSDGFTFGEMALIKRTKRNATIISLKHSSLLSIEKFDYNNIIRRLEEKRLEKDINKFKINYPFFTNWSNANILDIFNCFQHLRLTQGEFLFKQNDESDCIFIIKDGTFEMFCNLSFAWLKEYFDYILNNNTNLFQELEKSKPKRESELFELIDKIKKKLPPCPSIIEKNVIKIKRIQNIEENVFDIKKEEDELNDPKNLFRVNLKKIDYRDVIGLEETMELKKRFCSIKCVSSIAHVEKIKIIYLLQILKTFKNETKVKRTFENIILEKKLILLDLMKNSIKNKVNIIEEDFEKKYNTIIEKNLNKTNEESKNIQITTIKLRGWTKDLDYVLDEDIHFHKFPRERTLSKDIEKKVFGNKTINEKTFNKTINKPFKTFFKTKIFPPENLRLNSHLLSFSPDNIKDKNNKKNLNLLSFSSDNDNKFKNKNLKKKFYTIDYGNYNSNDDKKKKKKITFNNEKIFIENNNLHNHHNSDFINTKNNFTEFDIKNNNMRKKLILESFNSCSKHFFLGRNFSNKMKEEINKNKNICLAKTISNFTNKSTYYKK